MTAWDLGLKRPDFVNGEIAQLVEQRTENPCVPGSNPGLATILRHSCMRKKPLIPRGRVGRAVPIKPFDHETAKKPNPPTKHTHGELRVAMGFVVVVVCTLLVWFVAESIKGFAR